MVSWRFCFPPTRIQKTPGKGKTRWFRTPKEVGGGGGRPPRVGQKRGQRREGRPGPLSSRGGPPSGAPGRQGYVHVCFHVTEERLGDKGTANEMDFLTFRPYKDKKNFILSEKLAKFGLQQYFMLFQRVWCNISALHLRDC
jgi:hypothetical protein